MHYHLLVEDLDIDHWVAFVQELPGCSGIAHTPQDAIAKVPGAISDYAAWLTGHGYTIETPTTPTQVKVSEEFHSFPSGRNSEYLVNAFFKDDERVVTQVDAGFWAAQMRYAEQDLMQILAQVPEEIKAGWNTDIARDALAGVANHLAGAEWWYFSHLGLAFDRDTMPHETLAKLETVWAQTLARYPELVGNTTQRVNESDGEWWSARKVMRRALWHRREHTTQIEEMVRAEYGGKA